MKYPVSDVEIWGKELDALSGPDPGGRRVRKKLSVLAPPARLVLAPPTELRGTGDQSLKLAIRKGPASAT
jgi:hypothetical protein